MAVKKPEPPKEFTITSGTIKWIAGFVASVFAVVVGYWALSDRITSSLDARWRLEQVQAAKDKEYASEIKRVDADIKAAREKAESDTKLLAKKAEIGRAWVVWSITDSKADISTKFVKVCRGLKLPPDECASWAEDARITREEAGAKKRVAEDSGKEK